uniref:Uncharacterized protein n=1 Tax=Arundo donax TaxID=35708 RepID=A0A0A9B1H5_ARUDO
MEFRSESKQQRHKSFCKVQKPKKSTKKMEQNHITAQQNNQRL